MRRKFVQIAAFALFLCLLLGGVSASGVGNSAVASIDNQIIRIGLAYNGYGSSSIDGGNLANESGEGFRLGYFDSSNAFVQLGSTDQTAISVAMARNVGYGSAGGYVCYHESLAGSAEVVVGTYHLQLPGSYTSFADAQEAAAAYEGGFPAYIGGEFFARIGNDAAREDAEARQKALEEKGVETTIVGTSSYAVNVLITGTNTILLQFDDKGAGTGLGVMPNASGDLQGVITLFNTASFGRRNNRWYGGFRYERIGGGRLTVVNMIRLGDYLKGVLPNEISNAWPIEAEKAQAVAARTFALSSLNGHNRSGHFDLCPTDDCQAYSGLAGSGEVCDRAVEETAGVTVKYNGSYATCTYYSSNGGASMDAHDVWGSNMTTYGYLRGKADPYEDLISIPSYSWTRTYTFQGLTSSLGFSSTIASAKITKYTDYGNPLTIEFYTQDGQSHTFSTYDLVRKLGLRSYRYDLGPGGGYKTDGVVSETSGTGGGISVNGVTVPGGVDGLYAVDGDGSVTSLPGDAWVITGDGRFETVEDWSDGSSVDDGRYHGTDGSFVISGRGFGHNVGMSQYGAKAMADYGYTYKQILEFYYTGVTVG